MSEIEKLYENVGIRYINLNACKINETDKDGKCEIIFYPEFTAEKQLELIKWLVLSNRYSEFSISWNDVSKSFNLVIRNMSDGRMNASVSGIETPFEDVLAYLLKKLWQNLSDTEKAEIKRILE